MVAESTAEHPGSPRRKVLARYPLISYSILAYVFSWLAWLPFVLSKDGAGFLSYRSPINGDLSLYIAGFGPALAAFVMTGLSEGKAGIRHLIQRILRWRVGLGWYLFALVGLPVILTLGTMIVPSNVAVLSWINRLALLRGYVPFLIYPVLLVGGPLGEEPGWRGFALPRLQRRYGPLVGTIILALVWAFWHVPVWLTAWRASRMQNMSNVILFVLFISLWTFVFTWVFNNTRGSLLMAILLHASGDAFPNAILGQIFPASVAVTNGVNVGYYGLVIGYAVLTLLIVIVTKGSLSYERYKAEEQSSP